jgi:hypothetical protein
LIHFSHSSSCCPFLGSFMLGDIPIPNQPKSNERSVTPMRDQTQEK